MLLPTAVPDYPQIPHVFGSLWDVGDRVLGWEETQRVFGQCLRAYEKLDGLNLALGFEGPAHLWVAVRGEPPRWVWNLSAGLGSLALWASQRQRLLYRILGEEIAAYGEWLGRPRRVPYAQLPDAFCAFDFFHRRQGGWLEEGAASAIWLGAGLWAAEPVFEGLCPPVDDPQWSARCRWGGALHEGLIFRGEQGIHKWVRPMYGGLAPHTQVPSFHTDLLPVPSPP